MIYTSQSLSKTQQVELKKELDKIYQNADKLSFWYLLASFVLGIVIAPIYDTWLIALGIGSLNLILFWLAYSLPKDSTVKRQIISAIFAIFMLQLIAEMHGMAELHFIYFINITFLIVYQDWKVMIPFAVVSILHHSIFFGLQLKGIEGLGIYFINYSRVTVFVLIFHFGLAVVQAGVCAWLAYILHNKNIENISKQIKQEAALETIRTGVNFAQKISAGELTFQYEKEQDTQDILGNALLEMQTHLIEARKKETRDNYLSKGLNRFAKILQANLNDLDKLCDEALQEIVSYLNLQQAACYVENIDEEETYLQLKSCYAYDRSEAGMYKLKVAKFPQNLTVQSFLKKELIVLEDIPQNYWYMQSGLGQVKPKVVIVCPLESLNKVEGVVEIALAENLSSEQTKYLEEVRRDLAIAIEFTKSSQHTKVLLEKSEKQADNLLQKERELQQHLEEIQTTNEEIRQTQEELQTQRDYVEQQNQELIEANKKLKVTEQILRKATNDTNEKNRELEISYQKINSSIKSAKDIQEALLPTKNKLDQTLCEHFLIFRPRDVVSGDFYWLTTEGYKTYLAAADCTGHGVPGAFMANMGITFLYSIIRQKKLADPANILEMLHREVSVSLKQSKTGNNNGMDLALLSMEKVGRDSVKIEFCGAKRPLYYISSADNILRVVKGTRKAIGGIQNKQTKFETYEVTLPSGSIIYLGSDGLADQNNIKRKKLGERKLKKMLQDNYHLPFAVQKNILESTLDKHMEGTLQRDDILWLGIRI